MQGSVAIGYRLTHSNFSRYHCSVCGTWVYEDGDVPMISSGALEDGTKGGEVGGTLGSEVEGRIGGGLGGLVKLDRQMFLGDTKDGGMGVWMHELPAFQGKGEEGEGRVDLDSFRPMGRKELEGVMRDEKLKCACRCGGVEFFVTRPNSKSYALRSGYSDSLIPHFLGKSKCGNEEDTKWWIAEDGKRFRACLCACISCRRSSGFEIQPWAFVPKVNIFLRDGRKIKFDEKEGNVEGMESLKMYRSSEGVGRHFCDTCGATVFWRSEERPGLIDVSVGLMEARSGARAEEWLDWMLDRVSFVEFGHDKEVTGMLQRGLKRWKEMKEEQERSES